MKRTLTILLGLIAFSTTLPSFAGPDWQVIEHGRKVKLERMQRAATEAAVTAPTAAASMK